MKKTSLIICAMTLICVLCGCEEKFGIVKVNPTIGTLAGGEPIDIIGSGFSADMGFSIYFGPKKVDNVVVKDSKTLRVMSPAADEPGKIDVMVTTDDGKEFVIKQAFNYSKDSAMDISDFGQRKSLKSQ